MIFIRHLYTVYDFYMALFIQISAWMIVIGLLLFIFNYGCKCRKKPQTRRPRNKSFLLQGDAGQPATEQTMDINLEGLGVVREFSYKNGRLCLTIALEGLEDHPISIEAKDIEIAPDGSSVTVKSLMSDMPFAHNALNRFARGTFEIPESGRAILKSVKCLLGL